MQPSRDRPGCKIARYLRLARRLEGGYSNIAREPFRRLPPAYALAGNLAALCPSPAVSSDVGDELWPQGVRRIVPGGRDYPRLPARIPSAEQEDFSLRLDLGAAVRITDSTSFKHDGRTYRLSGTLPLAPSQVCSDGDGGRWACGLRGRARLRSMIEGKRLQCREDAASQSGLNVTCLTSGRNVAEQIVSEGLAFSSDASGPYAEDEAAARFDRKGAWAGIR